MKKYALPGIAVIVAGLIGFGGLAGFGVGKITESKKIEVLERKLRIAPTISADIKFQLGLRPYKAVSKVLEYNGKDHLGVRYEICSQERIVEEHLYFDGKKFDNSVVLDNIGYSSNPEIWGHGVCGEATIGGFFDMKVKQEDLKKGKTYVLRYEVIDEKGNKAEDVAILKVE